MQYADTHSKWGLINAALYLLLGPTLHMACLWALWVVCWMLQRQRGLRRWQNYTKIDHGIKMMSQTADDRREPNPAEPDAEKPQLFGRKTAN